MYAIRLRDHLLSPLEPIKDEHVGRVRALAAVLILGHLLFYWLWSVVYPQPYESLLLRVGCVLLGVAVLAGSFKYRIGDIRVEIAYSMAAFLGTVFASAWLYVANGGSAMWLATLAILTMIYFTLTDWRIALPASVAANALAMWLVPALNVADRISVSKAMDSPNLVVIGFTILVATMTRIMDRNWRLDRMQAQFKSLGVLAHELRTPLAGLQLIGGALEERIAQCEKRARVSADRWWELERLAHEVVQQANGLNALITTQLANSNPFKPFQVRERVVLTDVIHEGVQVFARGNAVPDGVVSVTITSHSVVMGEALSLRQVVINLLNNALNAVRRRHDTPCESSILVRLAEADGQAILSVTDNGAGIKKDERAWIFRPFHSGSPDSGHGLGLTLVKAVVDAYGGSIDVDSEPTVGTTFSVSLPLAAAK
jgi:two-component system CAI-1 autoinducer sensor kinase/phosphatase CqsS